MVLNECTGIRNDTKINIRDLKLVIKMVLKEVKLYNMIQLILQA